MFNCLEAAKLLQADAISAEVIDAACIKPLDRGAAPRLSGQDRPTS